MRLDEKEIKKRLSRLNNLEGMYERQVVKNEKLEEENKRLKAEIVELKAENKELRDRLEKVELIAEELRRMIFKKKKPKGGGSGKSGASKKKKKRKSNRDPESYRRNTPNEEDVTETIRHEVKSCATCGGKLKNLEEIVRYIEDICLPKDGKTPFKKVTKEIIEKGYCPECEKQTSAKEITGQHCTLGEGVKAYVVYATTALMLSYEQIQCFFEATANLTISDGEIAYILKKQSVKMRPEYEAMKERLRQKEIAHFDETIRCVQSLPGKMYGWVMTDTEGIERVYILGADRGGGNLTVLMGDATFVGVSDNYGVYKNAFKAHQLCWAHPIRKMRDLAHSRKLCKLKKKICKVAYKGFQSIHNTLLGMLDGKIEKTQEAIEGLYSEFDEITKSVKEEPEKLLKIRESLAKDKEKYFTCLRHEGVPTTNNVAERVLRPLVIKRKLSFGSKTSAGAMAMEVLYSITFTLLAKSRVNFFEEYLAL